MAEQTPLDLQDQYNQYRFYHDSKLALGGARTHLGSMAITESQYEELHEEMQTALDGRAKAERMQAFKETRESFQLATHIALIDQITAAVGTKHLGHAQRINLADLHAGRQSSAINERAATDYLAVEGIPVDLVAAAGSSNPREAFEDATGALRAQRAHLNQLAEQLADRPDIQIGGHVAIRRAQRPGEPEGPIDYGWTIGRITASGDFTVDKFGPEGLIATDRVPIADVLAINPPPPDQAAYAA